MAIVKLKAGETVIVAAVKEGLGPDQGLPKPQPPEGFPSHPIVDVPPAPPETGHPEHPIYPGASPEHPWVPPDGQPPVIWPPDQPSHPWVPPTGTPKPPAGEGPIDWKTAWSPATGWIVIGIPSGEHVTPSKRK